MNDDLYLTQTQIGKRYGNLSGKKIGQWLKLVHLRTPDGAPTKRAIEGRFCKLIYKEDWGGTFWVWHAAKTLAVLEDFIQNPAAFMTAQGEMAPVENAAQDTDGEGIEGDEGDE
jgi:hypothetical protein